MIGRAIFTRALLVRPKHLFSSFADPYFILGVDKGAPFPEIKKAFYKLANEFHPDKNNSQQAQQKFVVAKQAFEMIKMQKGLMKPQNLYPSEDKDSMRPNPEKYAADDAENTKNFSDYTVFQQKARSSQDYMAFRNSFKTINDINQIKIKVEEGEMKDPATRFNLDKNKGRISSYSESGNKYLFVILTALNQIFGEKQIEQKQNSLKKLTQIHKRKTIQSELVQNKKIALQQMERSQDILDMKKSLLMESLQSNQPIQLQPEVVISPSKINKI